MSSVLNLPTLKLNKNCQALAVGSIRKSIGKVFAGKARIFCPDTSSLYSFVEWMKKSLQSDDVVIRTTSGVIKFPEIIIMNDYDDDPNESRIVVYSRRNVWKRDKATCQFCGTKPRHDDVEIDHLLPKSRGGKSCFENVVLCCTDCNRAKADRTPQEAGMRMFRWKKKDGKTFKQFYKQPHRPPWSPTYSFNSNKHWPSWKIFLKDLVDDLYWDVELEE